MEPVTGGTPPYTYLWDDPSAQSTTCANNLLAGIYNIIVTDANGCTINGSVTINNLGGGTAVATVDNNVSCNGLCNGQATVAMSGGTAPFTYAWSSGGAGTTETGLCAGTHIVTITDAVGCVAIDSVVIGEPLAMTATLNVTDVSCNGQLRRTNRRNGERWFSTVYIQLG